MTLLSIYVARLYLHVLCMFSSLQFRGDVDPPQVTLPYQPPDVCAATGGNDDGDGGEAQLMHSAFVIILLTLTTLLF